MSHDTIYFERVGVHELCWLHIPGASFQQMGEAKDLRSAPGSVLRLCGHPTSPLSSQQSFRSMKPHNRWVAPKMLSYTMGNEQDRPTQDAKNMGTSGTSASSRDQGSMLQSVPSHQHALDLDA